MKTMLSMPRTISSAVSVSSPIQICGSENHSMSYLSSPAQRCRTANSSFSEPGDAASVAGYIHTEVFLNPSDCESAYYLADLNAIIERRMKKWSRRGPDPARTNRSDLVFCFALRAQMTRNRPAQTPESQKGLGGGFDPRSIRTSYAHFFSISAGFHKRGTDPLGSTILFVRLENEAIPHFT